MQRLPANNWNYHILVQHVLASTDSPYTQCCTFTSDAVAVYFNDMEVFPDEENRNVTDGCICTGDEKFYLDCHQSFVSRYPEEREKVAGALCQN